MIILGNGKLAKESMMASLTYAIMATRNGRWSLPVNVLREAMSLILTFRITDGSIRTGSPNDYATSTADRCLEQSCSCTQGARAFSLRMRALGICFMSWPAGPIAISGCTAGGGRRIGTNPSVCLWLWENEFIN